MSDTVLRVAVDARDLNGPHLRGMGRYLWEVIRHGSACPHLRWHLLSDRPDLPVHVPPGDAVSVDTFEWRGFRFHSWEQIGLPRRAAKSNVLHCPSGRPPFYQPVPTVVTIHDTIPWDRDEPGWGRGFYTDRLIPAAYKKCTAVITETYASQREIVRHWPELEPRISVIPLGVAAEYVTMQPAPLTSTLLAHGIREPYLLYFGGEIARKRLDWALRVFQELHDDRVGLVACGLTEAGRRDYVARVPDAIRDRLWFVPFLLESDLPRLYQNAIALLYPTEQEGFGFPVLEAQAAGTPAIFSPVSSLPELAGPAALLLEPTDLAAWRSTLTKLISERAGACVPREDSRVWAGRFTWAEAARRTFDVYERAARSTRRH